MYVYTRILKITEHMQNMAEQTGGEAGSLLQFVPFVSRLEAGFWHELGKRKLEKYKLSEEARDVHGYYSNSTFPRPIYL